MARQHVTGRVSVHRTNGRIVNARLTVNRGAVDDIYFYDKCPKCFVLLLGEDNTMLITVDISDGGRYPTNAKIA